MALMGYELDAVFKCTGFQHKCMDILFYISLMQLQLAAIATLARCILLSREYMQHQTCKDNGCYKLSEQRYGGQSLQTIYIYPAEQIATIFMR
jgi:hypothetical protein